MRTLFPDEFDFYPKTWFLPEQTEQFQSDVRSIHEEDRRQLRSLTTFIVKPSDGSQGTGIYLIRDATRWNATSRPHVVQGNVFSSAFNILSRCYEIHLQSTLILHF
ncbi:unnamed protein product [Rotaria sp. Silwood2]|nr:unnamed protein product [Rotaria sp. Silwood2]CAF2819483.1 unnamed protein product [Rotaria sp. Silwood2]CAF3067269.1 unnamed protein product [Rotaria sp. Silwood2]